MTRADIYKLDRYPPIDYNCEKCGSLVMGFMHKDVKSFEFLCCGGGCERKNQFGWGMLEGGSDPKGVKLVWLPLSSVEEGTS